jgi:hypothetical protein
MFTEVRCSTTLCAQASRGGDYSQLATLSPSCSTKSMLVYVRGCGNREKKVTVNDLGLMAIAKTGTRCQQSLAGYITPSEAREWGY